MPIRTAAHALLLALGLTACGCAASSASRLVVLDAEVTLAPGETLRVRDEGIEVQFVGVIDDSRCPSDVTCVWAGEVKVSLTIRTESSGASQHQVVAGESVVTGAHCVFVVRVMPEPVSTQKIAAGSYRATLKVSRASACTPED